MPITKPRQMVIDDQLLALIDRGRALYGMNRSAYVRYSCRMQLAADKIILPGPPESVPVPIVKKIKKVTK